MAIWHFRKRSTDKRKRPHSGNSFSDAEESPPTPAGNSPADHPEASAFPSQSPATCRRKTTLKKKRRTEPPSRPQSRSNTTTRHNRAYSFTEDQPDTIRSQGRSPAMAQDNIVWEVPTLSPQRPERNSKSSRRFSRRDPMRETEIQTLSADFNPRTNSSCSRQTSRKASTHRTSKHKHSNSFQNRYSHDSRDEMEFPSAKSLRSSMSSDGSDSAAYLVTALGSLAPRPTLRCASRPNWAPNVDRSSGSKADKNIDLSPTPANIKSRARINGLADDFDSTDLRTLMERDKRRRERKRLKDQERAAERIARKQAERVALAEQAAASGAEPVPNMERGVLGRELMDPVEILPEQSNSQVPEPNFEDFTPVQTPTRPITPMSLNSDEGADASSVLSVVENQDFGIDDAIVDTGAGVLATGSSYPSSEILPDPSSSNGPVEHGRMNHNLLHPEVFAEREPFTQPKPHASSVSFTPTLSPSAIIASDVDQSSTSTRRRSLRTMLRWGSRKRKNPQPVFINTSRDALSMETARSREFASSSIYDSSDYEVPMPNNPTRIVPRRTRSRFREDLPELPISPPASPLRQERDLSTIMSVSERMSVLYSTTSSPSSGGHNRHRSIDALNCSSVSQGDMVDVNDVDDEVADSPSPEPRSISMASVGSESEWLAGRLSNRNLPISRSTSHRYADSPELNHDDEEAMKISAEFGFVRGPSSQAQYPDEDAQAIGANDDQPAAEAEIDNRSVISRDIALNSNTDDMENYTRKNVGVLGGDTSHEPSATRSLEHKVDTDDVL
ncbi:hypothetical protein BROUX41_000393 [Berkeleyomyces rouxiae]|uniref:uncharacterized protein n=1 Tax=Berkeleyomyces rouxiae TaxID=2035830 RepID=UPI003B8148C4